MSAHDAIPALICFASDEAPRCIHDVFAARVLEFGDEPAIVAEGGILTYSELNERANATAHHLIEAGIRPGEGVALCADRSVEMVVTLLGLLKAGAFYVPIVPTYPEERIGFMLRDSGARLVVTQASYSRLFADSMRRVLLDEVATLTPRSDPPDVPSDPEALAYVMYTSGSTGEPKGAGVPHRAIERLSSTEHCVPTGPKRVILHAAPIAFDASTFEVWGPLLAGGTVALHDEAVPTASGLARAIEKFGVTGMWLTAALFNMVVDQDPQAFSNLQHLITGGEALSVEHVRRAQRALPHLELFNGYGPTETTTFATCFPIPRPVPEEW